MALLLTEVDVRNILTMPLALEAVEDSFRRLADGSILVHARRRLNIRQKSDLAYMAAGDSATGYVGLKIYTRSREGLRFLIPLFDAHSGGLLALVEAEYLGRMRTGAASGVATKFLARKDARTIAIIGTGSQARTQLEAVAAVRKIESVRAYSRDAGRREAFAKEMTSRLKMPVNAVESAEHAVRNADIVITATNSSQPVVNGSWIAPGGHINAIGANFPQKRELDDETVMRADLIVVDLRDQAKMEAGDLIHVLGEGASHWAQVQELAEIVLGKAPGRESPGQITLFRSGGIASEDIVTAGRVYELARQRRMGKEVDMWQKE